MPGVVFFEAVANVSALPALNRENLEALQAQVIAAKQSGADLLEQRRTIRRIQNAGMELGFKLKAKELKPAAVEVTPWVESQRK